MQRITVRHLSKDKINMKIIKKFIIYIRNIIKKEPRLTGIHTILVFIFKIVSKVLEHLRWSSDESYKR